MAVSGINGSENTQAQAYAHAEFSPDESTILAKQQESDFVDSLMISKDKDGDGILDLDESGLRKKEFAKYDIDANGKITVAEVQAQLDRLQQQKSAIGKLDVEMQQAEDFSAKGVQPSAQKMVSFEDSGLDKETFDMLDSDGDGKVSQTDINAARTEEEKGQEGSSDFSEALSEFEKSFFSNKKDDEEEEDLNKDGFISDDEREQTAKVTGIKAEKTEESANDGQKQGLSAKHIAGVRAYQNQAADFFAGVAQSTMSFEY
ncbi:hypothetical protein [Maridesulfovibrio sp.]|uniref:hypothetical protein n=1 Tax=Maridesulfovibrio sp. TaxID=2795000 RepID=UPI002AA85961|nr:hypothetical protein [Maridesulfovibrio sp.]